MEHEIALWDPAIAVEQEILRFAQDKVTSFAQDKR
jgi:hypothetical protein